MSFLFGKANKTVTSPPPNKAIISGASDNNDLILDNNNNQDISLDRAEAGELLPTKTTSNSTTTARSRSKSPVPPTLAQVAPPASSPFSVGKHARRPITSSPTPASVVVADDDIVAPLTGSTVLDEKFSSTTASAGMTNDMYKLLFAASGIYGAFLYYGSLQEDVFRFETSDGQKFTFVWCLQVFEALSNTIVGYIGRKYYGPTPGLSLSPFFLSGASQVSSKAFTSLSLASGLSFPVATLAKSGKMAPVMMGQLLLGGSTYGLRDYLQVGAIIGGTVLLSLGKKSSHNEDSTNLGVFFIVLSLIMDGTTAGIQKRLKVQMIRDFGKSPKPYDFMFFTNLSMMVVAFFISSLNGGEFSAGCHFLYQHAECRTLVIHFCLCSAIGQSFIFYTVAHFDPLVCTTLTTTRKVLSVIWSILTKGHVLAKEGWIGVLVASGGLVSEMHQKFSKSHNSDNNIGKGSQSK